MQAIFHKGDALLDCLPGSLAPTMAHYAKEHDLHYANLTEYVAETNQIIDLANDASTGFVLQTGLAPGYINILAHHLFQQFCADFDVSEVDTLEMKVGALTEHAVAPHYYGFTWSPIGVATEYIKDCIVLRNGKKSEVPALSERSTILINGIAYEDDLTSGGAADLPDALAGKVHTLDYKTLRHPGHYGWVDEQLAQLQSTENTIEALQSIMLTEIPHIEEDQVIIYAAVEGKDANGTLRRYEIAKQIRPQIVGKHRLRAIQTTTAVPLIQAVQWLLEASPKGVVLQSQLETSSFLNGSFIIPVYGKV
jgi:saccharopine dehydrogenase-like NADP-dependent oxidoreductase